MRLILFLLGFLISLNALSQKHEYINFYQVRAGVTDKAKIDFSWPDNPDSAKVLSDLKLRDVLKAIEIMENRGFELYSIHEYGPGNLVIVVSGYMRRKK